MKKVAIVFALAAAFGLAGCETPAPTPPVDDGIVVIDEECPRADGEPCK